MSCCLNKPSVAKSELPNTTNLDSLGVGEVVVFGLAWVVGVAVGVGVAPALIVGDTVGVGVAPALIVGVAVGVGVADSDVFSFLFRNEIKISPRLSAHIDLHYMSCNM